MDDLAKYTFPPSSSSSSSFNSPSATMPSQRSSDKNTPLVRHEHDEKTGFHRIILDRPKARNAISRELLENLSSLVKSIAAENGNGPTRALIVGSNVDAAFCAGADLKERATMSPAE